MASYGEIQEGIRDLEAFLRSDPGITLLNNLKFAYDSAIAHLKSVEVQEPAAINHFRGQLDVLETLLSDGAFGLREMYDAELLQTEEG